MEPDLVVDFYDTIFSDTDSWAIVSVKRV